MALLWPIANKDQRLRSKDIGAKLKACLLIILLFFLMGQLQAQENKAIDVTLKGLQIGQQVPDITITNLHNYKDANGKPATTAKISDFKGKLLILDFWATWCSPCIAMIPKMDSLQKQFANQIQFLSVSYQSKKEVLPFLEKLEQQKKRHFDLPVVTDDKELHKLFPHVSLPHYVWIDGEALVKAITGHEEVNENSLKKVLAGGQLNDDVKNDLFRDFNPEQSLSSFLADDSLTKKLYQATFSGHILGVPAQTYSRTIDESYTLTAANLSLRFLYKIAYSGKDFLKDKLVELAVADSSKLTSGLKGEALINWRKENTYCYQIKVLNTQRAAAQIIMRKDLAVFFPQYKVNLERKIKKCWVLKVVGDTTKLRKSDAKPYIAITPFKIEMRKANLSSLVNRLDRYDLQSEWPIFLDERLNIEVDLLTDGDTRSVNGLNKMLLPYGLAFISEYREQDVLVISNRIKKGLGDEG